MAAWLRLLLIAALVAQEAPATPPRAGGMIAGQVVDAATGKPLGSVLVALIGPGTPTEKNPPQSVLTGGDGRFVFPNLRAGDFGLSAVRSGYVGGVTGQRRPFGSGHPIALGPGERHEVVLPLFKYAAIAGTVVDEAGEPVIGAQVRAWSTRDSQGRRRLMPQGFAATDDRGYYRIHNLPPGEYVVGVGERHVSVPHSWSERVFPTVRQPPGKPGSATAIAIGEQVVMVGRGGAVPPPPRGQRLFVYPPTYYPATPTEHAATPLKLESGGEHAGIDLTLQPVPTFRVAGRLTAPHGGAGVPVRLSRAGVSSSTIEMGESITVSDQAGGFAFPAVPAGAYVLRAAIEGRVPTNPEEPVERGTWAEVPIDVSTDIDDLVLTLDAGLRITGRLEFDGTRRPPTGDRLRQIRLQVHSAQLDSPLRIYGAASRTDGSGAFTSVGLPHGRYHLQLDEAPEGWVLQSMTLNGRDVGTTPIELSRGDVTGVVLRFTDRPASITGVVRDDQAPDNTAAVVLFPTDATRWSDTAPDPPGFRIARANRTGDYAINNLPAGTYYVVAFADDLADNYSDPDFLAQLSTSATLLSLAEGERRVVDLRTVSIK